MELTDFLKPVDRPLPDDPYERALEYQDQLTAFFTGTPMAKETYLALRKDLLENPSFGKLAPEFLRRNRSTTSLWTFAKSVDSSWEPRRQFLRQEFEPLLKYLEETASKPPVKMPGQYDASAWTGVQGTAQQAHAIRTLIPVAQASLETLISHLAQPSHNGGPPLDEIEEAIQHLRHLHNALGRLLLAAETGTLAATIDDSLLAEIGRYGRRAAKTLRNDPIPYALCGVLLGICTAIGAPGLGGYLGGIAAAIRKNPES